MDDQIMALRNAKAQARIVAAAQSIATEMNLGSIDGLTIKHSDPKVAALFQREATADLLERIVVELTHAQEAKQADESTLAQAKSDVEQARIELDAELAKHVELPKAKKK
jgi:hypothetical protein